MVKGTDPVVVDSAIRGLEEQNLCFAQTFAARATAERLGQPVAQPGSPPDKGWDDWFHQSAVSDLVSEGRCSLDDDAIDEAMDALRLCDDAQSQSTPEWEDVTCGELGCNSVVCQLVDGFYVCKACGSVGDAYIETGAEWRSFGNEDAKVADPSRCGSTQTSYLLPEQSVGTMISPKWRESELMRHARQYHRWNSSNSRGRTLILIFRELQQVAYKHGFPRMIVEDTKHLYKTTTEYHVFRGDNRKGLYAYCLFHTCKRHGVPRSIKEICEMFDVDEQTLTRGHSSFIKVVKETETMERRKRRKEAERAAAAAGSEGTGEGEASTEDTATTTSRETETTAETTTSTEGQATTPHDETTEAAPATTTASPPKPPLHRRPKPTRRHKCTDGSKLEMMATPSDYVERFCSRLHLSDAITRDVLRLVHLIRELGLSTDNPALITAAAIHMARRHAKQPSTTAQIQTVSNISHVTIDKCYKKLAEFGDVLFEAETA